MLKIQLFVVAVIALATSNASAMLISNGSFETNSLANTNAQGPAATGWVGVGGTGGTLFTLGEDRGSTPNTPFGSFWGRPQGNTAQLGQAIGSVADLLDRPIDVSYILSRRLNEADDIDHSITLIAGTASTFAGGDVLGTTSVIADLSGTTFNMDGVDTSVEAFTTNVVASGSTTNTTLWLVVENDTTGQLFVDNVTANLVATLTAPEPSAFILAAVGLIGAAGLTRRRRRA